MKKLLKGLAWLLGIVVLGVGGLVAYAYVKTDQAMQATYAVSDPPLPVATDAATLARGAALFTQLGCAECHGAHGEGHLLVDAPPFRLAAPNITPAKLAGRYDADKLAAAIRHGVNAEGHGLRIMPAGDFHNLSDADTAALVAHVQALPRSTNDPGPFVLKPLGRVLAALGQIDLLAAARLDHAPRPRSAPPAGPTAQYGEYLAQRCTGCHRADFGGGHVPGTPREFKDAQDLTPHPQARGSWQLADFQRALRTGKRPDGSAIDTFMPWQAYSTMSDDEIAALYAYLRTVPAKAPRK
jgi:mono/diheme cytochrome c family protein